MSRTPAHGSHPEFAHPTPGYPFILREFLPRLRAAGLGHEDARALVLANPARFLAWQAG